MRRPPMLPVSRGLLALPLLGCVCLAGFASAPREGSQSQQQGSQAQQGSPEARPNPPSTDVADLPLTKPKKVWTNDDVVTLRSPADVYLAEKEAEQAAEAAEAAKRAQFEQQVKQAGLNVDLPPTAEDTQRAIDEREAQVQDLKVRIDRLNQELPDAPEARKPGMHKDLATFGKDLNRLQMEIRLLRYHLQDLPKPKQNEPSPAPPPENPQ